MNTMWLKRTLVAGIAAMGVVTVPAVAYTIDGDLSDWGVSVPGSGNHDASEWTPSLNGICWVAEDYVGAGGFVDPGHGGQNFDAEAMYIDIDWETGTLYFALATGHEQTATMYPPGDVFFGFGQYCESNEWDVAVGMDNNPGRAGNVYDGSQYQTAQDFSGLDFGDPYVPYRSTSNSPIGQTNGFTFVNDPTTADHNIYEFSLALSEAQLEQICRGGLSASWTMGCGNDVISGCWDFPCVPEPASMLLLGMGIAGMASRKIIRKRSSH